MNEILGLNLKAWGRWMDYRSNIRKPYKSMSLEAAQLKLASFGEYQMQVVEQSIERGWTGLFELPKKVVAQLEEKKRRANAEKLLIEDLRKRAEKIGYRDYISGEDVAGYRFLVEREERNDAERRWRAGRPKSVAELLEAKA
jgi:hypothetical protein